MLLSVVTNSAGSTCTLMCLINFQGKNLMFLPNFLAKQVSTAAMLAKAVQEPQEPWALALDWGDEA